MKVNKSDLIKNSAKDYIGKRVYFFDYENIPRTGLISGVDEFQFFVGEKYGLAYDKSVFFFSLEEMFSWIKENVKPAT
jgi:hypothetical protein